MVGVSTVAHKCHVNIFLLSLTKHFHATKPNFWNANYYFMAMTKSFPRDTELSVMTKFFLVTKLFVMTNFFLVTKLFLMTNFFLVTIFFYFATIPSSEYVNMADNNNNEMNEEDEDDLLDELLFSRF